MKLQKLIDKLILYQHGTTPSRVPVCDPHSFYITDEDCETIRDALALVSIISEATGTKDAQKWKIVAEDIDK